MPPKRAKSSNTAGPTPESASKAWEAELTAAPFEEEGWRACVSLVVAVRVEDEECVKSLLRAVQQPQRRLFNAISWDTMLEKVNELGNTKAKKPKDVPLFYEVTESAKVILDAGGELPAELLGKLVKFLLLAAKSRDMQRRADQKAAEDKARTQAGTPAKDKAGSAVKPSGKADKGKKAAELSMAAKETKLKRRGEEDDARKYIDDEPDDGPQLYVLLVGFYQPQLLAVLDSLDIHVSSVIRLSSDSPSVHHDLGDLGKGLTFGSTTPHEEAESEKRQKELDAFWRYLEPVLNSGSARSKLFDVARLSCTVKRDRDHLVSQSAEDKLGLGTRVFEDVACLLYNCLDWQRQHQHYVDMLRLISVPRVIRRHERQLSCDGSVQVTDQPPPTPSSKKKIVPEPLPPVTPESPPLTAEVDMRYYCALLNSVPPVAQSVPLLLHCMLEQVVATQEAIPLPCHSEPELHRNSPDQSLAGNTPRMERQTEDCVDMLEKPLLLKYHDNQTRRLGHLPVQPWLDPMRAESDMSRHSPMCKTLLSHKPLTEDKLRMARLHELKHFCRDVCVTWPQLQHMFSQLVFECMLLTSVDQDSCLSQTTPPEAPSIPWDDPVSFSELFRDQQICRLKQAHHEDTQGASVVEKDLETAHSPVLHMSVEAIRKARQRSLTAWHVAEYHDATVFPQVLENACHTYHCMDTLHRYLDNTVCVVCHHPMGHRRQSREFWEMALHTDVGFRWYLEYVASSILEWTQQEEEKWQARQAEHAGKTCDLQSREKDSSSSTPPKVLEDDGKELYIREDSLKAWMMAQEKLKEEEIASKMKKEKRGKGSSKAEQRAESSKEGKKSPLPGSEETVPPVDQAVEGGSGEDMFKGFTGYSMDGTLIRVSGQIHSLFPSDGGLIRVETVRFVEGSTFVLVSVTKDKHHFVTHIMQPKESVTHFEHRGHSAGGEESEAWSKSVSRFGSFTALLSSGIRLSLSHHGNSGESTGDGDVHLTSLMEQLSGSGSCADTPAATSSPPSAKRVKAMPKGTGSPSLSSSVAQGAEEPISPAHLPFQTTLSVSDPSGLVLQFLSGESSGVSEEDGFLVRQHVTFTGSQAPPHTQEHSRVINMQGTVVKYKKDGSTEILFADGTVSSSPDSGPVWQPSAAPAVQNEDPVKGEKMEAREVPEKKGRLSSRQGMDTELKVELQAQVGWDSGVPGDRPSQQSGHWVTTTPSGLRVATFNNQLLDIQPALAFKITDPDSGTVVVTREDRVLTVLQSDGTVIVEHADGTRITTMYKETQLPPSQVPGTGRLTGPRKEKLVRVEGVGFATVVINYEERTCNAVFGDGTVITVTHTGAYQIVPSSGGFLYIDEDGTATYTSHRRDGAALAPGGQGVQLQPGSYVMRHTSEVVCEVTDTEENLFQVMVDGNTHTVITKDQKGVEVEDEEEEEEEQFKGSEQVEISRFSSRGHKKRFFIVYPDGSGTELICLQDMEEFLLKTHSDQTAAVVKDAVSECPGALAITVLRPCTRDSASQWIVPKQNLNIFPPSLRSRRWDQFPSKESKMPDTAFGTDTCVNETPQSALSYPEVLEVRQFIQHRRVGAQLRRSLEKCLKEYMDHLLWKAHLSEEMKVKEPRPEEDRVQAAELLQLVLSLPEQDRCVESIEKKLSSADMMALYDRAFSPTPSLNHSQDSSPADQALARCRADKRESLWPQRLEQHRQELSEEEQCRDALRRHRVPPYFHSDCVMFQLTQEVPDMESLSKALPPLPQRERGPVVPELFRDDREDSTSFFLTCSSRPLTPSSSHARGSHMVLQADPASPTPQAQTNTGSPRSVSKSGPPKVVTDTAGPLSTVTDETGSPHKDRIVHPSVLLSAKPKSLPNHKFLNIEEPVRRKLRTVSVVGAGRGRSAVPRGFELRPAEVEFGFIQEGATYRVTVVMRNVGVDSCRLMVKQPPPATGLRVIYHPGAVAAGMKTDLQVELFAMAVGEQSPTGETFLSLHIEILTETEILYLPVSATVLSKKQYEHKVRQSGSVAQVGEGKARLISTKAPVQRGVLRPARHIPATGGE